MYGSIYAEGPCWRSKAVCSLVSHITCDDERRSSETIEGSRTPVPTCKPCCNHGPCGIDPIPVLSAQSRLSPAPRCLCHRRRHCRCRLRRRCRRRRHILYTHFTMAQKARSSQRRPCEFGGMQLFAPEAWRAAPLALLLTRSAQMAQPTVRLPQLSQRWARPHWPSVTRAAACVSDTARRLPAHCETMGVR